MIYHQLIYSRMSSTIWDAAYREAGPAGKWWIDASIALGGNRFHPRSGNFSIPYEMSIPNGFEIPKYDSSFNMTFEEVTDLEATRIGKLIDTEDAKIAVFYSGGMDSVVVLASLIKNLTDKQMKNVFVCMNLDSIIEYPAFFIEKIAGKLNVLDSANVRYTDLLDMPGWYTVSADLGDAMFGTDVGMKFYHKFQNIIQYLTPNVRRQIEKIYYNEDPLDKHYSAYKDVIVSYLDVHRNIEFGEQFYHKIDANIKSTDVPLHSINDFFWWYMFNTKYLHCSLRAPTYMYEGDREGRRRAVQERIIHWFNTYEYQQWSMNNNNNGQKIRYLTPSTYKYAAREYIETFFGDKWFRNFKLKIASLKVIWDAGNTMTIGLDDTYEPISLSNPQVAKWYQQRLIDYKLDWM